MKAHRCVQYLNNQYCKTNLYFYNITFYINGFILVTLLRESYSHGKKRVEKVYTYFTIPRYYGLLDKLSLNCK